MWTNHSNKMKKNMMICLNVVPKHVGDTTYTKTFVGGLAWETNRDTLKHYVDLFGYILEVIVITDIMWG